MNKEECDYCVKRKTIYCPNSNECYSLDNLPYFQTKLDVLKENQKYKEVIDNVSSQIKLYGKYDGEKCTRCFYMMTADLNKLLDILKEVE